MLILGYNPILLCLDAADVGVVGKVSFLSGILNVNNVNADMPGVIALNICLYPNSHYCWLFTGQVKVYKRKSLHCIRLAMKTYG